MMDPFEFITSRSSRDVKVNTVFGGLGQFYPTPQDAIALLENQSNPNVIQLFEIDFENNIRCSINEDYDLNRESIREDNLTFFYDFEAIIKKGTERRDGITSSINNRVFTRCICFGSWKIGNQDFRLTPVEYVLLIGPISIGGSSLIGQCKKLKRIYLPNLTSTAINANIIGSNSNSGNNEGFTPIFYFNKSLETSDNGNMEPYVANLIKPGETFTNEVRFIENEDKPNPVSDVSVSNITANSAQINFTSPPINTNANDFYYVYIDYIGISFKYKYSTLHEISAFFDEISNSGDVLGGLPADTNIKVQIQTVDYYHNVSTYSNPVFFKTAQS